MEENKNIVAEKVEETKQRELINDFITKVGR